MKQMNWLDVRSAMREAVRHWIYDPNVTFIDFGWRIRGNKLRDDKPPCVRFHLKNKIPKPELETAVQRGITNGPIPDKIGSFEVDRPVGKYRLHQWWRPPSDPRESRMAPMQGGISISDAYRYIAGTLGGAVIDRDTGKKMILSNWHVLAGRWHARQGWPICQPGRGDGGSWADIVATLSHHAMDSNLDAAVAKLSGNRQLINDQFELAPVAGADWAHVGMDVIKSGRTSDITRGRVTGVEGTAKLPYNGVYRLIRNVMTIVPRRGSEVSAGGDSGSFWLDEETLNVVGLHFAGSDYPEHALAIDIHPILDALNVNLDTG